MEETLSHEITLRPVGVIRNRTSEPSLVAGSDGLSAQEDHAATMSRIREKRKEISEIIINSDLEDLLDGIEDYSHVIVLYWAHRVDEQGRSISHVHPMGRRENPLVGIYATCSPARPNPVLMTVVRQCERDGHILKVAGIDAVDGSPVIDIKPYVAESYPRDDIRIPGWMQQIQRDVRDHAR